MTADLGIDGGGTGSRWCLADGEGRCVAAGEGPSLQVAVAGVESVVEGLRAIWRDACAIARPDAMVAGMAGAGRPAVRIAIREQLDLAVPMAIVGDVEVAAGVALAEHPGVAIWAGTGSFTVARGPADGLARAGGRGWLLGDEGGAFWLVRAAAAALVRAADGWERPSILTDRLCSAFEVSRPQELGVAMQNAGPGESARHAPLIFEAFSEGDVVARRVVEDGASLLARMADGAAHRAGSASLAVTFGGSVLTRQPAYRDLVLGSLQLPVDAVRVAEEPRLGAARLARGLRLGDPMLSGWLSDDRTT